MKAHGWEPLVSPNTVNTAQQLQPVWCGAEQDREMVWEPQAGMGLQDTPQQGTEYGPQQATSGKNLPTCAVSMRFYMASI